MHFFNYYHSTKFISNLLLLLFILSVNILPSTISQSHEIEFSSESNNSQEVNPELQLALTSDTAVERRKRTIKKYAAETHMHHLPNMFKSKAEIEAYYAEDVKKAEAYDAKMEKRQITNGKEKEKKKSENSESSESSDMLPLDSLFDETSDQTPSTTKRLRKKNTNQKFTPWTSSRAIKVHANSNSRNNQKSKEDDLNGFIVPDSDSEDDEFVEIKNIPASNKSLKRKRAPWNDEDSYDNNHPEKVFSPKKASKITKKTPPSKPISRPYAHTNPIISSDLNLEVCIYDTETTALSPKCGGRVCEFAGILMRNGIPHQTLHFYLNPDMKSWYGAFKAHGLSETFLRPQAPFHKFAKSVHDFFGDRIRCAHNGFTFDDNYMNYELTRAWVFFYLKKVIDPNWNPNDNELPSTIIFDDNKIQAGHQKLIDAGLIVDQTNGSHINIDQEANTMAAAAMMYFFKDHLSQTSIDDREKGSKPGPMMFQSDGRILPDQELFPKHYEAAAMRLAYFRLIRVSTESREDRMKLSLPHEKPIRDAIILGESYLKIIVDLFESEILDKNMFLNDKIDRKKMFDSLYHAREHKEVYTRGSRIDNLKLDSLLDYYGINRYDRESGNHGAGIDTILLAQTLEKMYGISKPRTVHLETIAKMSGKEQENYFFKKNSLCEFDNQGKFIRSTLLHDDKIGGGFGDPKNERHTSSPKGTINPGTQHYTKPITNTTNTQTSSTTTLSMGQMNQTLSHSTISNQPKTQIAKPLTMPTVIVYANRTVTANQNQEQPLISPHELRPSSFTPANNLSSPMEIRVGDWSYVSTQGTWKKL